MTPRKVKEITIKVETTYKDQTATDSQLLKGREALIITFSPEGRLNAICSMAVPRIQELQRNIPKILAGIEQKIVQALSEG